MKTLLKPLIAILILTIGLASCKKDSEPGPVISGLEIGSNNNKTAYPGADLHFEAEIFAPGKIASVHLEIHAESGSGWHLDQVFTTGLVGLKNADFHEHIDIPEDAALGHYHVHLSVTDQNGATTEVESELEIKIDPTLPTLMNYEVELEDDGEELHVEAEISAPNKIASVVIEVHGSGWEKEFTYTDAAMVGQTTHHFHKHVDISAAPKGHYHIHLKVTDQQGKENEFEEHFDKP